MINLTSKTTVKDSIQLGLKSIRTISDPGATSKLRNKYDIEIKWRAYPLQPDVPEQGLPMARLLEEKGLLMTPKQVTANLKATAHSVGLPFGEGKMIYNSRLVQEVGLWAQECGQAHPFHDAAFKAYFVDDRNLADKTVVLDIAASAGLDVAQAEKVIGSRSYADAVDRDWAKARELELVAAPTFFMKDQRLVGAKPYQVLEKMVAEVVGQVRGYL